MNNKNSSDDNIEKLNANEFEKYTWEIIRKYFSHSK